MNNATLESLYDSLDILRYDWHMAYENMQDDLANKLEIEINAINRTILDCYDELSLIVYYQWK